MESNWLATEPFSSLMLMLLSFEHFDLFIGGTTSKMKSLMKIIYHNIALFLIVFLLINVAALTYIFVERHIRYAADAKTQLQDAEQITNDQNVGASKELVLQLMDLPSTRPHPFLILTEGISNKY